MAFLEKFNGLEEKPSRKLIDELQFEVDRMR
jgi:hypothetical protein